MESVMLTDSVIIIGFIISLALCVFALVKEAHISVTVISIVIFTLTITYALLAGADLYEAGTAASVFFIINMLPLWKKEGDK